MASSAALLGGLIFVLLNVVFMLLERGSFDAKLDKMVPDGEGSIRLRKVIEDINRRVGRYLVVKTLINIALGVLCYVIMLAYGLEFAVLWAMVIALVNWVQLARIIYTETRSLAEREYVLAERSIGAGPLRILFRHMLPHIVPTMLVYGTLGVSTTVLLEATLSFLGVGVQPPTPSWGNIINENQTYFSSAPWLVFIPGAAIIVLALGFNLVGDALRDILDPRMRT